MDIIAAYQHGLIEQLQVEAAALAGRPNDHAQRAVVLHHIYDHSRGGHGWALAEARRELTISAGLAALTRRIERWGWLMTGSDEAEAALKLLADALAEEARLRTMATYRAYRLSATAALRAEAEAAIPAELLACLDRCHATRRSGEAAPNELQRELGEQCEQFILGAVDRGPVDLAWYAVERSSIKLAARRLLGDKALRRSALRDERRGWARVEQELRHSPALPSSFRANPAQHFYALQHALAERRRQRWREECDRESDAFELAA